MACGVAFFPSLEWVGVLPLLFYSMLFNGVGVLHFLLLHVVRIGELTPKKLD